MEATRDDGRPTGDRQPGDRKPGVATRTRALIRRNPTANRVYRTGVGVAGAGTVALGIVMIPLPGPGALIAVGGLALLGTEFEGAKKVSTKANAVAKKTYEAAKSKAAERRAARRTPPV
jgi:uncharacterized protein (TIGR02611 family)